MVFFMDFKLGLIGVISKPQDAEENRQRERRVETRAKAQGQTAEAAGKGANHKQHRCRRRQRLWLYDQPARSTPRLGDYAHGGGEYNDRRLQGAERET